MTDAGGRFDGVSVIRVKRDGGERQAKPGEHVVAGQPIVELRGDDPARLEAALAALAGAIEIGDDPPPARPLILERIGY